MKRKSKEYKSIIEKLVKLGNSPEEKKVAEEAADIIADYMAAVEQANNLTQRYMIGSKPIKRGKGVYCCPECTRMVRIPNEHCARCGKKLAW